MTNIEKPLARWSRAEGRYGRVLALATILVPALEGNTHGGAS